MSDGVRRAMRIPVSSGTSSVHSEMLKVDSSPVVYWTMLRLALLLCPSPATKKIASAMSNAGTVVCIM